MDFPCVKKAMFEEGLWREALSSVQTQFNIEQLFPEQQKSIRAFMEKGDFFVNLPTGYGKSLIFQCSPIVADVLNSKSISWIKSDGCNFTFKIIDERPS